MALEENLLGIVHPVLFCGPGNTNALFRGEAPRDFLSRTLQWVIDDPHFDSIELTRIKNSSNRKEAIKRLTKARKDGSIREVVYCAQLVQLINEDNMVPGSFICSLV